MTFSPLADMSKRIPDVGRSSPRMYAISGVGVHYQFDKNAHTEATNPAREVSANYWIDDDGTIRPNIDESRRAWTSGDPNYPAGAQADHRNITVEVSCVGGRTDRISDAALDALARLIGDVYRRYGLGPVKRGASKGVGVHRDWVATACPGNYMMNRLPSIIAKAEQYRVGGAGSGSGDEEMTKEQYDGIIKFIGAQHSVTRGSSNISWLKRRIGGSNKGESITAKLNRVLGGIEGLEDGKSVDVQELAELVADAVGPRIAEVDAAELAQAVSAEFGKRLSEQE